MKCILGSQWTPSPYDEVSAEIFESAAESYRASVVGFESLALILFEGMVLGSSPEPCVFLARSSVIGWVSSWIWFTIPMNH